MMRATGHPLVAKCGVRSNEAVSVGLTLCRANTPRLNEAGSVVLSRLLVCVLSNNSVPSSSVMASVCSADR